MILFLPIFKKSLIQNRKSKEAAILRQSLTPTMFHMSHVTCHMSYVTRIFFLLLMGPTLSSLYHMLKAFLYSNIYLKFLFLMPCFTLQFERCTLLFKMFPPKSFYFHCLKPSCTVHTARLLGHTVHSHLFLINSRSQRMSLHNLRNGNKRFFWCKRKFGLALNRVWF